MQLDDEILEVYNEFEKNYKSINDLEKMELVQYSSQ